MKKVIGFYAAWSDTLSSSLSYAQRASDIRARSLALAGLGRFVSRSRINDNEYSLNPYVAVTEKMII
jgi:hypothetical protein